MTRWISRLAFVLVCTASIASEAAPITYTVIVDFRSFGIDPIPDPLFDFTGEITLEGSGIAATGVSQLDRTDVIGLALPDSIYGGTPESLNVLTELDSIRLDFDSGVLVDYEISLDGPAFSTDGTAQYRNVLRLGPGFAESVSYFGEIGLDPGFLVGTSSLVPAVPEPGTALLFGMGVFVAGALSVRGRRSRPCPGTSPPRARRRSQGGPRAVRAARRGS